MDAIIGLQPGASSMVIGKKPVGGWHGIALILTGMLTKSSIETPHPSPRLLSIIVTRALPGIHRFHVLVGYAPATSLGDPRDTSFHLWVDTLASTLSTSRSKPPWLPTFLLANCYARMGRHATIEEASFYAREQAHNDHGVEERNARGPISTACGPLTLGSPSPTLPGPPISATYSV